MVPIILVNILRPLSGIAVYLGFAFLLNAEAAADPLWVIAVLNTCVFICFEPVRVHFVKMDKFKFFRPELELLVRSVLICWCVSLLILLTKLNLSFELIFFTLSFSVCGAGIGLIPTINRFGKTSEYLISTIFAILFALVLVLIGLSTKNVENLLYFYYLTLNIGFIISFILIFRNQLKKTLLKFEENTTSQGRTKSALIQFNILLYSNIAMFIGYSPILFASHFLSGVSLASFLLSWRVFEIIYKVPQATLISIVTKLSIGVKLNIHKTDIFKRTTILQGLIVVILIQLFYLLFQTSLLSSFRADYSFMLEYLKFVGIIISLVWVSSLSGFIILKFENDFDIFKLGVLKGITFFLILIISFVHKQFYILLLGFILIDLLRFFWLIRSKKIIRSIDINLMTIPKYELSLVSLILLSSVFIIVDMEILGLTNFFPLLYVFILVVLSSKFLVSTLKKYFNFFESLKNENQ